MQTRTLSWKLRRYIFRQILHSIWEHKSRKRVVIYGPEPEKDFWKSLKMHIPYDILIEQNVAGCQNEAKAQRHNDVILGNLSPI